jgi:uncharacterized membrane protein (DUF373 family)
MNSSHDRVAPQSLVPYTGVRHLVRRFLEPTQDVLIVVLALLIFGVMVRTLGILGLQVLGPVVDFRVVTAEALFILVLVELLRLMVIYLRDHHVAVDLMVELSIVSALREVVLLGVVELSAVQVLALAAFVLALGLLLRFGDLRVRRHRALALRSSAASSDAMAEGAPEPGPVIAGAASARCCNAVRSVQAGMLAMLSQSESHSARRAIA